MFTVIEQFEKFWDGHVKSTEPNLVVFILGLLAAIVGPSIIGETDKAKVTKAQVHQNTAAQGFNQNSAGLINKPPTKMPANGTYTKTSRSL